MHESSGFLMIVFKSMMLIAELFRALLNAHVPHSCRPIIGGHTYDARIEPGIAIELMGKGKATVSSQNDRAIGFL